MMNFLLMHREHLVAKFDLQGNTEILNPEECPYPIRVGAISVSEFLRYRSIDPQRPNFVALAPAFAGHPLGRERYHGIDLMLSLSNYCCSVADAYWVNPVGPVELTIGDRPLLLTPTDFHTVYSTIDQNNSSVISDILLYDISHIAVENLLSFDFTTHGACRKRWIRRADGWWLEKVCESQHDAETELQTFEVFQKHGFVIPEAHAYHLNCDEKEHYSYTSRHYGFDVICKRRWTNSYSELIPLSWYADSEVISPYNVRKTIELACEDLNARSNNAYPIRDVINMLLSSKNARCIAWDNFGFYCKDNEIVPAVWGCISAP